MRSINVAVMVLISIKTSVCQDNTTNDTPDTGGEPVENIILPANDDGDVRIPIWFLVSILLIIICLTIALALMYKRTLTLQEAREEAELSCRSLQQLDEGRKEQPASSQFVRHKNKVKDRILSALESPPVQATDILDAEIEEYLSSNRKYPTRKVWSGGYHTHPLQATLVPYRRTVSPNTTLKRVSFAAGEDGYVPPMSGL